MPISLELQRELHRMLGVHQNYLQRVIIDIQYEGPPAVYAVISPNAITDSLVELIRLKSPDVHIVRMVTDAVRVHDGQSMPIVLADAPDGCSGDDHCPVLTPHPHMIPKIFSNGKPRS